MPQGPQLDVEDCSAIRVLSKRRVPLSEMAQEVNRPISTIKQVLYQAKKEAAADPVHPSQYDKENYV